MSPKRSNLDCLFLHVPEYLSNKTHLFAFVNLIAIGVFSMCNELKKNNLNPQIIHLLIEKIESNMEFSIINYIKKNKIKLVALSLHWYPQTYDTMTVAKAIKEACPDTFITLGGITASAFAEEIMQNHKYIDAIIKGEGEIPIVKLAKKIKQNNFNLSNIENLYWRKDNNIIKNKKIWFANKDELNNYNFDGFEFLKNYKIYLNYPIIFNNKKQELALNKKSSIVCCLGRGCPGNCSWCGGGFDAIKEITGRNKITIRDPKVSAKEFIKFKTKYNIDRLYFCYDAFPENQDYILEIFDILGKELPNQINITFECFGLPTIKFINSIKKNLSPKSTIAISPEFANENLRRKHKSFSYSNVDLFERIDYILEQNLGLVLYFTEIVNEEDFNKIQTKNLIKHLSSKYKQYIKTKQLNIKFQPINLIEPFSPLAKELKETKNKVLTFEYLMKITKSNRDLV